jgi:hypothetical protein
LPYLATIIPPRITTLCPRPSASSGEALEKAEVLLQKHFTGIGVGKSMPGDFITRDPDVLGGVAVFAGTRVPVRTLFDYLEDDFSLAEFLEFFPTVPR